MPIKMDCIPRARQAHRTLFFRLIDSALASSPRRVGRYRGRIYSLAYRPGIRYGILLTRSYPRYKTKTARWIQYGTWVDKDDIIYTLSS